MSRGTVAERLVRVEEWQDNHETRCEERYAGIQADVRGIRGTIWKAALSLISVLLLLCGGSALYIAKIAAAKLGLPSP